MINKIKAWFGLLGPEVEELLRGFQILATALEKAAERYAQEMATHAKALEQASVRALKASSVAKNIQSLLAA